MPFGLAHCGIGLCCVKLAQLDIDQTVHGLVSPGPVGPGQDLSCGQAPGLQGLLLRLPGSALFFRAGYFLGVARLAMPTAGSWRVPFKGDIAPYLAEVNIEDF